MIHKTTLPRRGAALLLALLLAAPPVYADTGAGARKLQTSISIVGGLTYRNTVSVNSDSRVESFSLELAPDSQARPILVQSAGTIYGAASINRAVSNAQEAGYHVLAAINTDFFSMSTGVPMGIVIEDGVYKASNDGENAMTIGDGGVSIVPSPSVAMSLYDQTSGHSVIPNYFNKYRTNTGGIYLYNEYFSTASTRSDGSGWYVRMKVLSDSEADPETDPEAGTEAGVDTEAGSKPNVAPDTETETKPSAKPNIAPDVETETKPNAKPDGKTDADTDADPDAEADTETAPPQLTVNSVLTLEVTELLRSDQSVSIGPDEYILTAADASGWSGAFDSFQLGDLVTLTTACSDPVLSAAQWAGGVGDIMVQNGALTDSSRWVYAKDGRQPRSAMGLKPDGTVLLYAVDGRQTGYSIGLSQRNLAEALRDQGCTTVVNLDGGGSTSFSLWLPGAAGPAVQNKPSQGSLRACATFLLLVTDEPGSQTPQRLVPKEDGLVVLTGSSLTLPQVSAVDEALNPVSADLEDLSYTSLGENGVIQDGIYTAVRAGTDTIRLTAEEGALTGSIQIHVVDTLTEFKITQSGSSAALASLPVKPGQQVQLAASGSYWGRAALRDFAPVTVSVPEEVGTVDSDGLFTAGENLGHGGSITFSAGGMTQSVQIAPAYVHDDVQPDHWAYDAVEYCYAHSISNGISSTLFGPDNSMIRGDFMLMLYNAAGKPAADIPTTFTDVAETDYYYTALSWAQSVKLATGFEDGGFAPRDPITREQAFTLLYRYLPIIGKSCPDGNLPALSQFADQENVSEYARLATATLVSQGLVAGSGGSLSPRDTLTRAQMATLLARVLEHTPVQIEPGPSITPEDPTVPTDPTTPTDPTVPTDPTDPVQPEKHVIALDQSQVTLASGGSITLNAVVLPNVENASITWTSSSPDTAVVSASGMVTNLHTGNDSATAVITASWNGTSASCTVTCQPARTTGTVTDAERGLNIRSGPGTSYSIAGSLRNGTRIIILSEEPGWYQILFRNTQGQAAIGYVSADYVAKNQ